MIRPAETVHVFDGAENFSLRVFNNEIELPGSTGYKMNNDSLVLQVVYEPQPGNETTVLFTGDIDDAQGEALVGDFGDELRSDVVKIPHHGSDHLFDEFTEAVAASIAVVSSTGTHGTFKHPRKAALDLY